MKSERWDMIKKIAEEKGYGHGIGHADQVKRLSLKIYSDLVGIKMLEGGERDKEILEAAALLHDIGFPAEPHDEVVFDFLFTEIPKRLPGQQFSAYELSTLLYCILWHRGQTFAKRSAVDIVDIIHTKKMAAIIRVADALDRTLHQLVKDVSLRLEGSRVIFTVFSNSSVKLELDRAQVKADLFKQAYALTEVKFEHQHIPGGLHT